MTMNANILKSIRCKVCFILSLSDIKIWKRCLDCILSYSEVCMLQVKRLHKHTMVKFKVTDANHFGCLNLYYKFAGNNTRWQHRFAQNKLHVKILADQFSSYLNTLSRKKHYCILILKHIDCTPYLHVMQIDQQNNFVRTLLVPSAENRKRYFYNVICNNDRMTQFYTKTQTFINIVMHHIIVSGQNGGTHSLQLSQAENKKLEIRWSLHAQNGANMRIQSETNQYTSTYFSNSNKVMRTSYFFTYFQKLLSTLSLCKTYNKNVPLTFKVNEHGLFMTNNRDLSKLSKTNQEKTTQKIAFQFFLINADKVQSETSAVY